MQTASKIDLYREHRDEYDAAPEPRLVTIAPARYLTIEGRGEPGGQEFQHKLSALYGVLYTIKMASKRAGQDFKAGWLEGLWWTNQGGVDFLATPRNDWRWKLLVRVPELVSTDHVQAALQELKRKKKEGQFGEVRLENIEEGECVQAMHIGSYATEPETLSRMDALVSSEGLAYRGFHHEIYLSDPRRTVPERMRTILRHSVG